MIVLESQHQLGDDAHKFYNSIIAQSQQDQNHIQHIQDFWGDPLTAAGAQSADSKRSYLMSKLAGNQGSSLANRSFEPSARSSKATAAPPGVKAYVTSRLAQ